MSEQRYSATATGRERIALAVSGGVVLVFVLLDRLWLALAAFVVVLAVSSYSSAARTGTGVRRSIA